MLLSAPENIQKHGNSFVERSMGEEEVTLSLDHCLRTEDVLSQFRKSGKSLTEWGRAIDRTPILSARTGGDKQPAIVIAAGVHCTETAEVHGALNILD